ncbi:MAG: GNAT family N-acetyltransferase [Trueperaceae bacterium]|nr:GNAT family N-acetyltransferase [Trueperaceae bacterium]
MMSPTAPAIRQLEPAEHRLVPALWNAAWRLRPDAVAQGQHLLTERVWRERLAKYHEDALLLGAFDGSELVGVVYGRASEAGRVAGTWQAPGVGWLSLLAVKPEWQGVGVGAALARALIGRLVARGCHSLRIASEPNHLLAGVPMSASPAMWRLARRLGARFTAAEFDLHLDLRPDLYVPELPEGWRISATEPAAGLAFVQRVFPGRWASEVADRLAAGATIMTLLDERAAGSGAAEGFCMVYRGDEGFVAPSLAWAADLSAAADARTAGMGPLGISEEARGQKLGLTLVAHSAAWLKERGATDLFIDWTTLSGFYGRLGARVWRAYHRAEIDLADLPDTSASTSAVDAATGGA